MNGHSARSFTSSASYDLLKRKRKNFPQGMEFIIHTVVPENDHEILSAKLLHDLTADPAGRTRIKMFRILSPSHDRDGAKRPFSFRDGFKKRRAFRTIRRSVRSIFHIAPGKDTAIAAEKRRPHLKTGIRRVCSLPRPSCFIHQISIIHLFSSFFRTQAPLTERDSACTQKFSDLLALVS